MILGIDGGGTVTAAVLFDRHGTFLAQAAAGSINTCSNPLSAARDNLRQIIGSLREQIPFARADSVFIGSSALNGEADPEALHALTDGILDAARIGMNSDLYIALEAMQTDAPCAVAICGTGSMAVGRDVHRRILHKGGYGYLLGDEGSGYAIALDAVRAALRSADGSGEKTALEMAMYSFFSVRTPDELIPLVYDPPIRRQDLASFLPLAAQCAAGQDNVACGIFRRQAEAFADTVRALLRELPPACPIGLWGGVFRHVPVFKAHFTQCIPDHPIDFLPYPPQIGAAFAAWKQCGIEPTAGMLRRIRETFPEQDV